MAGELIETRGLRDRAMASADVAVEVASGLPSRSAGRQVSRKAATKASKTIKMVKKQLNLREDACERLEVHVFAERRTTKRSGGEIVSDLILTHLNGWGKPRKITVGELGEDPSPTESAA